MRNRSIKPVLSIETLHEYPQYILPDEVANHKEGKNLFFLFGVNSESWKIPIGQPVVLLRKQWHLLNNIGIIAKCSVFQDKKTVKSFDPIRNAI